ncbi:hypothetical protein GCM10010176_031260 [Nonomuraea spiralis]|nr:hypothetical protein GCM10010176_031260 [Nonomuraea spiralis]
MRSVGALFRVSKGDTVHCAATAVQSRRQNLIMTSARCLVDLRTRKKHEDLVFIPQYHDKIAPRGVYLLKDLFVPSGFLDDTSDPAYDYGFATVYNGAGSHPSGRAVDLGPLGSNVPTQGLAWNRRIGSKYHAFGYPRTSTGEPRLFPGSALQWCEGPSGRMSGHEALTIKCRIDRMASGGPVIDDFEQRRGIGNVVGVVSDLLGDTPGNRPDGLAFAYFNSQFAYLYAKAAARTTGQPDLAAMKPILDKLHLKPD